MQAFKWHLAATIAVSSGLAAPVWAQQYRGEGGTLLDRNLQVGSGGKNVKDLIAAANNGATFCEICARHKA